MVLGLAWRNALRNPQRTSITALMVVLGTALLVVGMTWTYGLTGRLMEEAADQMGHVRIVDPDYAAREQLMPLYENIPDADPVVEAVRKVPGVVGVWPLISAPVTVTAGEEIGDVFGLAVGADPEWLDHRMRLREYHTDAGAPPVSCTFRADEDAVVSHVRAPLAGVKRVDMLQRLEMGGVEREFRLEDVPFDPASGEVVFLPPVASLKQKHRVRVSLLAVGEQGETRLGEYTFDHTPAEMP